MRIGRKHAVDVEFDVIEQFAATRFLLLFREFCVVRGKSFVELLAHGHDGVQRALRRLKKKLDKEGTLKELRNRRHYEKPSEVKRREAKQRRR